MIRTRTTDGVATVLPPEARFVEITDLKGDVGYVIVIKDGGEMQMFSSRDKEMAERYAKAFKVTFCPLISVPENKLKP